MVFNATFNGLSWLWSYGSWIHNYLCNQCLSPLTLWVRTPLRRGVLDTTLCDKICQWLATGRWFSPGTVVSSTNKTDDHDITEILLKVALNTIKPTNHFQQYYNYIVAVNFIGWGNCTIWWKLQTCCKSLTSFIT
jgi:hypothetical protein